MALLRKALDFFARNEVDVYIPAAGISSKAMQVQPQDPAGLADLTEPPRDLSNKILDVNVAAVYTGVLLV